jgi:hypothetical protein
MRQNQRMSASLLGQPGSFLGQHVRMGLRQWQILRIIVHALANKQIDIPRKRT